MTRTILIAPTEPSLRRDLSAYFGRFDYATPMPDDEAEVLAPARATRGHAVLLADADRGGLGLARAARTIRPDFPVVLTCVAPHRLPRAGLVDGAPLVRAPTSPHLLLGVVAGLGRRAVDGHVTDEAA